MIPQRIEPVFTERYELGESVLSAQVNSVKGVYRKSNGRFATFEPLGRVLSGVYKLRNLSDAQERGLTIFWAHDLKSLTDWIE